MNNFDMKRILTIISILWTFNFINQLSNKKRIMESFNQRFDSLQTLHRQIPATLYNPGTGKCVLVYPDSIVYKKAKGEIK